MTKLNEQFNNRWKTKEAPAVGDYMSMRVVAISRDKTGWSAYIGPADESDEEIAEDGDKIPEAVATALFPAFQLAGLQYRP